MLPKHVGFGVSPDELSFHESPLRIEKSATLWHRLYATLVLTSDCYRLRLMMVTTDWYWRLFLVIVFHRTQGPKTTVKTESSVLLHGCFLATVSSSKHQKFDPSMTMPCINCGPCIPYTLKRTNLQPPTYPSTLKFAKLLFVPSLLQVAALRTTSQKERFDWTPRNTSNIINGVRSEDSGKIQAHALSWTVPERWEPGALRLAVTRQIMSNAMFFSSFLMCIYAICFDFRFWWEVWNM